MNEQFEKFHDEFLEFNHMPEEDKLSVAPDVCGFLYLLKLMPEHKGDIIVGAMHDKYWLSCPNSLSDDDVIYLLRCGFHWCSECDCLSSFA